MSQYNEIIYFTDGDDRELLERNQDIIVDVLSKNRAVGVVSGFYEEGLPLYFISQFMLDNMGYTYENFMANTGGNYAGIIWHKDVGYVVDKLWKSANVTMEYRCINSQGMLVWVNAVKKDSISMDGRKMWIMAVRVVDDAQRREIHLLNSLGNSYESIIYADLGKDSYQWLKRAKYFVNDKSFGTYEELKLLMNEYLDRYVHKEETEVRRIIRQIFDMDVTNVTEGKTFETTYRRLNNNRYEWILLNVTFGGSISLDTGYIIFAFRNVDERIRKEMETNQLLSSSLECARQANYAKREFLSKMSHDIRTPLASILNVATLAANEDVSEHTLQYLKMITTSGKHLMRMFEEILEMSEIESGNIVIGNFPINLSEFSETISGNVSDMLLAKKQKLVVRFLNVTHYDIIGDVNSLTKIFINLICNASEYSSEDTEIVLEIEENEALREGYAMYTFRFIDHGLGIPDYMLERIFEPFERVEDTRISKKADVGLGLAITKGLVDVLYGTINIDSKVGEGSCFTVKLDFKLKDYVKSEDEQIELAGMRVLLVEDNDLNRSLERELLHIEGIVTEEAINGRQAVEMFAMNEKGYYDAILMDIRMPVMNGYTATRCIRSMTEKGGDRVPIIAVTADAFNDDLTKVMQAGMDGHIKKPFNFDDVKSKLRKCRKNND